MSGIMSNVPRAIANCLWHALPTYDKTDWGALQRFIFSIERWQFARFENNTSDVIRNCALHTYDVLIEQRKHLFCTHVEWANFLVYLDQLQIVGIFGSLQSVDLLVCLVYLCQQPKVQISFLGIRRVLTLIHTKENIDFTTLRDIVLQSSDIYDCRREFTTQANDKNILVTTQLFMQMYQLKHLLQLDLILNMLWAFTLKGAAVRSQLFPIIDLDDASAPPPSRQVVIEKKDFLVYLPQQCFVLSRTHSTRSVILYQRLPWRAYVQYVHNIIARALWMIKSCNTLWIVHYRLQAKKVFRHLIYKITYIHKIGMYIQKKIMGEQFRAIVITRIAITKWLLRTRDTLRKNMRTETRKLRKKEKVQKQRALHEAQTKFKITQKLKIFFWSVIRIRLEFGKILRKARTRLEEKKKNVLFEIQKQLTTYIITTEGKRCLAVARMMRSMLKQMLRITVKCLSFFNGIVDGKTTKFHDYIQIFTFAVEPFHFFVQTAPNFPKHPTTTEYLQFTCTLMSNKFSTELLEWILEHEVLRPFVGCLSVFMCTTSLFVEFFQLFDHIPNHMLQSTIFVPFTLDGIEKDIYQGFCKKYQSLAVTWVIDQATLCNIVEIWLAQGGKNIDLLDMLHQIQKTYLEMEKMQTSSTSTNLKVGTILLKQNVCPPAKKSKKRR